MIYHKDSLSVASAGKGSGTYDGVQFLEDGGTVATNGHVLLRYRAASGPNKTNEGRCLEPFRVSIQAAKDIGKGCPKKAPTFVLDVPETNQNGQAVFLTDAGDCERKFPKESTPGQSYPDYEKVLPTGKPALSVALGPAVLEALLKTAKAIGASAIQLHFQEELEPFDKKNPERYGKAIGVRMETSESVVDGAAMPMHF